MTLVVTIIDKTVFIDSTEGSFKREFDETIAEYQVIDNRILIRFQNPANNRNVYCLNERGDILWQIQDPNEISTTQTPASIVGFVIRPDVIKVISWNSRSYELDIQTGQLANPHWSK